MTERNVAGYDMVHPPAKKASPTVAGVKRKSTSGDEATARNAVDLTSSEAASLPSAQQDTKTRTRADSDNESIPHSSKKRGARAGTTATKKRDVNKKRGKTSKGSPENHAPWPDLFIRISRIHRALNIVYTFCCTRKHFATTFDNIKNAVQAQLNGQELTVEDMALVKVLVPWAVRLEYVDEASLDVMSATSTGDREKRDMREYGLERPVEEGGAAENKKKDMLLFEFVDADLKKQSNRRHCPNKGDSESGEDSAAEIIARMRPPSKEDTLKMPVFSQKQMLMLIEKRNTKFTAAIDSFLTRCQEHGADPVKELEQERDSFLQLLSTMRTNIPADISKLPREIPKERKSIPEIIADMRGMDWYSAQIVPDGHRVFDAQPAVSGDLNFRLSQNLVNALYNTKAITQLYSHQAEAINHLYDGHNVVVSTSTSSGKSLIYQIPMIHELERDWNSRGMYIFPTKALAQDQRRSMRDLLWCMDDDALRSALVETFDGDTPMEDRLAIREEARIIFTNPDILHVTILPQEGSWRTFLRNLKFVVVDELHAYTGMFGSHVALIMRRLRRLCASAGNMDVRFISCSATVANPVDHMKAMFGVDDVELVDFDGSPSGRKEFLCWNTPLRDPADPSLGRGEIVKETAQLFCQLVLRGVRVIAFARIRKLCESLLQAVRDQFRNLERSEIGRLVMGYRGGYSAQDRRTIERDMFEGRLMGIVATNALELGVDIGSLDAVITMGFPYSISNLRQQSGRAGRRNKDSVSVLVGDRYPTDQHYMKNPDELFTRPNCELQVDLTNELILEGHIQCAAFEMPIRPDEDSVYFGPKLAELAETRLRKDTRGFYQCHERFLPQPSRHVSIRDTEDQHFAIVDTTNDRNIVLEEIEASRALFTVYEGGIFLHQGQTYLVTELSPERRLARIVRVHVDWSTMQRDFTDIDPIETESQRAINTALEHPRLAFYGSIQIHSVVYGFFKVDKRGRVLDAVAVDNPPIDILSKGMWLDVPVQALKILESRRLNIAAAIHAAEHAVLSLLPSFVISSPGDVRTECKVAKKELGRDLKLANSKVEKQISNHKWIIANRRHD